MTLSATPVQTRDFRWELRFNYAFNRNKVVKLNDGAKYINHSGIDTGGNDNVQLWSFTGRPMGDIYALAPRQIDGKNLVVGGLFSMGTERTLVGNALPDAVGGFGNTISYKNLSLDFLLDFRIGGKVMNWGYQYSMSRGTNPESLKYRDAENGGLTYYFENDKNTSIANIRSAAAGMTTGPNGEKILHDGIILDGVMESKDANGHIVYVPNTQITPVGRYYSSMYAWGASSNFRNSIFDNSYLKVRELSLRYQLPASVYSRIGCRNMSISVFGRNLFYLFKNMPMFDAEATDGTSWVKQSQIGGATATTRTVGLSLRAGF